MGRIWDKLRREDIRAESFLCKRLRDDRKQRGLVSGFTSIRNPSLSKYLQFQAYKDDIDNYRSVYIVWEKTRIVAFFSLQCGLLIKSNKKMLGGVEQLLDGNEIKYIISDDKIDVTQVLPGIELSHFCTNDNYLKRKTKRTISHGVREYSIGAYIFYKYIVPKILDIANYTGLQYVYLFCDDNESDGLVKYYSNVLGFSVMDHMACVRQNYDESLTCMTIKLDKLNEDYCHFLDMAKSNEVLHYLQSHKSLNTSHAKSIFDLLFPRRLFDYLIAENFVSSNAGLIRKIDDHKNE